MPAILAIDAAWTAKHPSGVAVIRQKGSKWRCAAVAPSYEAFMALADGVPVSWHGPAFGGSAADVNRLLSAAQRVANCPISVVAVDMPLATVPLVCRRVADDAVSKVFGARWCSAHSPSPARPGPLGKSLGTSLAAAGYPPVTTQAAATSTSCTIEVYPHPALLSLMKRSRRVPYKVSKSRKYWPEKTARQRIDSIVRELAAIETALRERFGALPFATPAANEVHTFSALKRHEDALDALVCAWVGTEFLAGAAVPLGDATAAVWCPRDAVYA